MSRDIVAMLDEEIAAREGELGMLRRARAVLKDARPARGIESRRRATGGRAGDGSRGERRGRAARHTDEDARSVVAEKSGPPAPRRTAKVAHIAEGGGMPSEKHCGTCGKTKPAEEFGINRAKKDGLQTVCKTCQHGKRVAPPVVAAPVVPRPARVPNETPSNRLTRLKKHAQAMRNTERAGRVPVRCKMPGPDGKPCGAVVMSHKATLHAYQEHKKNVPIDLMGEHFERAPEEPPRDHAPLPDRAAAPAARPAHTARGHPGGDRPRPPRDRRGHLDGASMTEPLERLTESIGELDDIGIIVRRISLHLFGLPRGVDVLRLRLDRLARDVDEIVVGLRVEHLSILNATKE